MERTRYLIIGAGVTGLAFADWLQDDDYWVVEAEDKMGGYTMDAPACIILARKGRGIR